MKTAYICLIYRSSYSNRYNSLSNQEKSKLGSVVLSDEDFMENELSSIKATSRDCLEYLRQTVTCRPFKVIEKNKGSGGSFSPFRRIMTIGPSLDKSNYRYILTVAHEYAHACQYGKYWTLFSYFLYLYAASFLFTAFLLLTHPDNPSVFIFMLLGIIFYLIGHTPKEMDAIFRSISFIRAYLKGKELDQNKLNTLIEYIEHKSNAVLIWYLISDIEGLVALYFGLLITATLLRSTALHILKIQFLF